MKITIPALNENQIRYTIQVMVEEFLGLDIEFEVDATIDHSEIFIGQEKAKLGSDYFSTPITYTIDELPASPVKRVFDKDLQIDFVSLFNGYVEIAHGEKIDVDILGSTFFMLTRWEEYVLDKRDKNSRFQAKDSLAFRNGFLSRPIVNEYVELLWKTLQKMGCTQKRKERSYTLVPTHDVDKPYLYNGWQKSLRTIAGRIKQNHYGELGRFVGGIFSKSDPFDTYDLMMDLSEEKNTKSHFFFLQKGKAKQDEIHDINTPRIKKLIQHIVERGHHIGFHPSYNTYNDTDLFGAEKEYLEKVSQQEVNTGRHHFLRWDAAITPNIWNTHGMKWDSTLSYADHAGFRCGVCYPFPLYDLVNNKQLEVFERPLIAMEWSLVHYQNLNIEEAEFCINQLKSEVKKYNGEFVFLYHNSAFFVDAYRKIEERLLKAFYN